MPKQTRKGRTWGRGHGASSPAGTSSTLEQPRSRSRRGRGRGASPTGRIEAPAPVATVDGHPLALGDLLDAVGDRVRQELLRSLPAPVSNLTSDLSSQRLGRLPYSIKSLRAWLD